MSANVFNPEAVISAGDQQLSSRLGEEVAILDLRSGIYYGLGPVGARVWELAQQRKAAGDIRDAIVREFDVEAADCERDLADLFYHMEIEGLIRVTLPAEAAAH